MGRMDMMRRLINFAAALIMATVVFTSSQVSADSTHIEAFGRLRSFSSPAWISVQGDFIVSYHNDTLPWGTTVRLRHGFKRADIINGELRETSTWNDIAVPNCEAVGPFRWEARVSKQLSERNSSFRYTALEFVIEVIYPDGSVAYEKGSDSLWGYFEVDVPQETESCRPFGSDYCILPVHAITKY